MGFNPVFTIHDFHKSEADLSFIKALTSVWQLVPTESCKILCDTE